MFTSLKDHYNKYILGHNESNNNDQQEKPQPSQKPLKQFPVKDILNNSFYSSINWNNSVIAGSYALQQFTGDTWEANDIDIMIQCKDVKEFEKEVGKFIAGMNQKTLSATVVKTNLDPHNTPISPDRLNGRDERFNESIIATCTLNVEMVPKPVQFVAIDTGKRSLLAHLHDITDVPACVNYTIEDGRRIFHIGEKCAATLFTRKMYHFDICQSRKDKYKERGYDTL